MKKYQYTIALIIIVMMGFGCKQNNNNHAGELNIAASLPERIGFQKMGLKVITSMVNKKQAIMSTLYGNDAALNYAASGEAMKPEAGMVFALVSWQQQEDERWFGAKIPGALLKIEFLKTKAGLNAQTTQNEYECYMGKDAQNPVHQDSLTVNERISYIFAQRAAVMP